MKMPGCFFWVTLLLSAVLALAVFMITYGALKTTDRRTWESLWSAGVCAFDGRGDAVDISSGSGASAYYPEWAVSVIFGDNTTRVDAPFYDPAIPNFPSRSDAIEALSRHPAGSNSSCFASALNEGYPCQECWPSTSFARPSVPTPPATTAAKVMLSLGVALVGFAAPAFLFALTLTASGVRWNHCCKGSSGLGHRGDGGIWEMN